MFGKGTKVLFLIVVCTLIVSIACISQSSGGAPATSPATSSVEKVGRPIKMAILGPMEHTHGKMAWWGASLAADEINNGKGPVGWKKKGILVGDTLHPIELIKVETNELASVPDAVLAIERAITVDKADIILGGYRSEAILAMQDIAAEYKRIFLNCGAHPSLTKRIQDDYDKYKYCFHIHGNANLVVFPYKESMRVAIDAVKNLGIKQPNIAVIAEKVLWTEPVIKMADGWIDEFGCKKAGLWQPSVTATDLTTELTAIKNANPDIIYTIFGGPIGITFQKQWTELKIPTALCGNNQEAGATAFWNATAGKADYAVTYAPISRVAITPVTIPFWDNFEKLAGTTTTEIGVELYDGVYIAAGAIERAKTFTDQEALVDALEATDMVLAQGRIKFVGKNRAAPSDAMGLEYFYVHDRLFGPGYMTTVNIQWQNGKIETIWPDNWHGITYEGTKPYQIAPWAVDAIKARAAR